MEGWGTRCIPIPLFHVFGLGVGLVAPLLDAEKSVFSFFFPDTLATMKAIHEYKCNSLLGAPTILLDLLNSPERAKFDLSSLQKCLMVSNT